jgi:RimJ/RimL family protein N-acetyltransferase
MASYLETDRLLLRGFCKSDFESLRALDTDPEVMRFITDGTPRTDEEVRAFLTACIAGYAIRSGFGYWAALELPSQEFVGWFHFRPDRLLPDEIEVGYRLTKAVWGRGLATEGSKALILRGFMEQNVASVTGRTMKGNLASANVLSKVGLEFVEEYEEDRFPGPDKTALLFRLARKTFMCH